MIQQIILHQRKYMKIKWVMGKVLTLATIEKPKEDRNTLIEQSAAA